MQSSRSAVRIRNDRNKSANESGGELTYLTESELQRDTFAHKREPLVPDPWPFACRQIEREDSRLRACEMRVARNFRSVQLRAGPMAEQRGPGEKPWGKRTHVRRQGKETPRGREIWKGWLKKRKRAGHRRRIVVCVIVCSKFTLSPLSLLYLLIFISYVSVSRRKHEKRSNLKDV